MQVTGTLIEVLPQVERGQHKATPLLIEQDNNRKDPLYVEAWGEKADLASKLKTGTNITVFLNAKSNKHNERWFTNLSAWKWTENA